MDVLLVVYSQSKMLSSIASMITVPVITHSVFIGIELFIAYRIYNTVDVFMNLYKTTMSGDLTALNEKIVKDVSEGIDAAIQNAKNDNPTLINDNASFTFTGKINTSFEWNGFNMNISGPFELSSTNVKDVNKDNTDKLE